MKNICTFNTIEIVVSTIILGLIASFSHFVYSLSGKNVIAGLINPVNESVWEHLKFMFFPLLIWWIIMYFLKGQSCDISLNSWIVAATVSLIAAPLLVVLLFYAYTGGFGIESIAIDILLVFVCFFISLIIASHLLKHLQPNNLTAIFAAFIVVFIFVTFIIFTFNPPKLPIFQDATTKTYGI